MTKTLTKINHNTQCVFLEIDGIQVRLSDVSFNLPEWHFMSKPIALKLRVTFQDKSIDDIVWELTECIIHGTIHSIESKDDSYGTLKMRNKIPVTKEAE